ncbi:MAG TPA: alkaline phosphatase PhoX [Cellvibrio sp.]|nr:alkaline phosphatase PhoX [Cellvibrio sp.]
MNLTRRHFLHNAGAAAVALAALRHLPAQAEAYALDPRHGVDKYGPLVKDPLKVIDLPTGFRYSVIARTGDPMSDGLIMPGAPDGMAAFPDPQLPTRTLLVRNHELSSSWGDIDAFGGDEKRARKFVGSKAFDFYRTGLPANGGTTTLRYNQQTGRVERSHLSLAGTSRNCSGGATPWGSWLTCEETVYGPDQGFGKKHGFVFEVPASATDLVAAIPLTAMGRFSHEACAVDVTTGIVYQTEDAKSSLFYRFIPTKPGALHKGGKLQALAIRDWRSANTRNWQDDKEANARAVAPEQEFLCDWINLDDVTAPDADLAERGHAQGAAIFARGEGLAFALRRGAPPPQRELFFSATTGGNKGLGQIWRYQPSEFEGTAREREAPGKLSLVYESQNRAWLDACDNLVIAPWGDLIVCEDSYSDERDNTNYLRGLTPQGKIYTLAMNAHKDKGEFCGACFSPDGTTMFVNIQQPGLTLAITGPWQKFRTG